MKDFRQEFKELVIELIHGVPYEEAVEKEIQFGCLYKNKNGDINAFINKAGGGKHRYLIKESDNGMVGNFGEGFNIFIKEWVGLPITIGRVMSALGKIEQPENKVAVYDPAEHIQSIVIMLIPSSKVPKVKKVIKWQLLNDGKSDATDDYQTDETIRILLELLKESQDD